MAALSNRNPTLLDRAQMTDPDGKIAVVAEILNEVNEILEEMTFVEGNLTTGHRSTIRAGIPPATWRAFNEGVQPNKSATVQVTNNTGMLVAWSQVDKSLAKLASDLEAFRLTEDTPHIEGMNQEMAETLFYGNEGTEPQAFTGLSPYYNDLSAENADNVIDALGTGTDNGSIWLIVWSPTTIHGIVPKGSEAGLQINDLGEVTITNAVDADGNATGLMQGYRTNYEWHMGLVVRDWRYAVRIANIDKSNLSIVFNAGVFASPSANLPNLMYQAMRLIPHINRGRAAFYMSRTMATAVAQQSAAATVGSTITMDKLGGDDKFPERFHGVPMRRVDALSADEARVT